MALLNYSNEGLLKYLPLIYQESEHVDEFKSFHVQNWTRINKNISSSIPIGSTKTGGKEQNCHTTF